MKVRPAQLNYQGKRTEDVNVVGVLRDGEWYPLPARLDLVRHSPDGFEWGYGGSGPAQLSVALLADYFGTNPEGDVFALAFHQDFKFAIVAGWDRAGWELSGEGMGQHLVRLLVEDEKGLHRLLRHLSDHLFLRWNQDHEGSLDPADYEDTRINAWITKRCRELLPEHLPLRPETVDRLVHLVETSP